MVSVTDDQGISIEDISKAINEVRKAGYDPNHITFDRYKDEPLVTVRFRDGSEYIMTYGQHNNWYITYETDPGDCKNLEEFKDKLMVAEL